jgi:hypothetical protein
MESVFSLESIRHLLSTDYVDLAISYFVVASQFGNFNFGCIIDTMIIVPVSILIAINISLALSYHNPFLGTILLTKASDFIKGLKDLPEQEAIDKIRAELDDTMSRPITPESERYMDDINDELEKRTS